MGRKPALRKATRCEKDALASLSQVAGAGKGELVNDSLREFLKKYIAAFDAWVAQQKK
jgi:hypothetical protein